MTIVVTSANRLAARRLICAQGKPASEVRAWTLGQLQGFINDEIEAGRMDRAEVEITLASGSNVVSVDDVLDAHEVPKAQTPATPPATPKATPAADIQSAVAEALGKALGPIFMNLGKQGVDADQVRQLVREELEALAPRRLEVKRGDIVKTVTGRTHAAFADVLAAVSCGLHVWLVGPSGSGKSHMVSQVAEALGRGFFSTGAIASKFELIGFVKADGAVVRTPFRDAFENGGVFSWDDVDGSDPRALVAFNEALANGRFAFPDGMVTAHEDFVAVASANTWGQGATADYVGRAKMDAATMTRFVQIHVDYDEELERELVGKEFADWSRYVQRVRAAVGRLGIKVLVTPRQTMQGAKLLAAGMTRERVESVVLWKGMDAATIQKVRQAA